MVRKSLAGKVRRDGLERGAHGRGELRRRQRGADHQVHGREIAALPDGQVHLHARALLQRQVAHVAHHANHAPLAASAHDLAEGILRREQRARHGLVDHDHRLARGRISFRDIAAGAQRNAHGPQVAVAHHAHKRVGELPLRVHLRPWRARPNCDCGPAGAHRSIRRPRPPECPRRAAALRRSRHSAAPAWSNAGPDPRARRRRVPAGSPGSRRARAENSAPASPRPPAARRQTRSPRPPARRESSSGRLPAVEPRVVSFSASCRALAGTCSAGARPKTTPVSTAISRQKARAVAASVRTLASSGMLTASRCATASRSADGQHHAQRRAAARKRHAFGQHLADQPPPPRPQRRADGNLLLPRRRPRQQQVGEIGADDQHHHADGACQHQQRRPDAAAHVFRQRGDVAFKIVALRMARA